MWSLGNMVLRLRLRSHEGCSLLLLKSLETSVNWRTISNFLNIPNVSFGDTKLNLSGKGRNHLDLDYYLSTSLAPSWKDGSGSRISPDTPSALETRKESWGVMDIRQSTQQYLAWSTHVPKAAWLSVSTCPLLSVCPLAGI